MGQGTGLLSLAQYRRHIDDDWCGRLKRNDLPSDVATLLELSREIELTDRIVVDVSDSLK